MTLLGWNKNRKTEKIHTTHIREFTKKGFLQISISNFQLPTSNFQFPISFLEPPLESLCDRNQIQTWTRIIKQNRQTLIFDKRFFICCQVGRASSQRDWSTRPSWQATGTLIAVQLWGQQTSRPFLTMHHRGGVSVSVSLSLPLFLSVPVSLVYGNLMKKCCHI